MRVGLISFNGQARNAIGNHLAEKLRFFLDRGADARVFLQEGTRLHPALAGHVDVVDTVQTSGPVWDFLTGADLVLVDFAQAHDLLNYLPLLAGGKPRLLLEYHGITPSRDWPPAQRAVLEKSLALRGLVWCADFALVHSRFIRDELVKSTGFPEDRIYQLDFPLDERFHPGPPIWSLRQHLGLGTARILLYVGRLAPNKRVPLLIEAVSRMAEDEPPVHAVIVGDNGDVYAEEQRRCIELANQLGVLKRIHFLGAVEDDRLANCYKDADMLVIPSSHEGFCIPIMEAMACGLPVLAARATALPETIGAAGLTFAPGDAEDLASQINRILGKVPTKRQEGFVFSPSPCLPISPSPCLPISLSPCLPISPSPCPPRVAIVCFRFGSDIVGGAETSLRKIALALTHQGRQVEVFTTCTRAESDWSNELPAGTTSQDELTIHRFPIDDHDRDRHLESVRALIEAAGQVEPKQEQAYLDHSIHSQQLLAKLAERLDEFEAVIVGPYLFGLTMDVAQAFPQKTLLLSCFHQEPLARIRAWPMAYNQVGGILYHSPEERELAQNELGINHPNSVEIGTFLSEVGSQKSEIISQGRYIIYCGRYSRQKEVPRLLEFASRYSRERPGRFAFVFMGQGEVSIPKEDWASDLGRVDDATKQAVLSKAAALVQLSLQESLSLVALEAWARGTPVVVDKRCPVLAGQLKRSGGGWTIVDYAGFAKILDDLWEHPNIGKEAGRRGQAYVQERYASESTFAEKVLSAIAALRIPLREQMRQRGLARAARSKRLAWRERFGLMVEQILDAGPRPLRTEIMVTPFHEQTLVKTGTRTLLVPVRVHNRGTHAICAAGPARRVLCCAIGDQSNLMKTHLPGLLLPGKLQTAAALIAVPSQPGEYVMRFWLDGENDSKTAVTSATGLLMVGEHGNAGCTGPFLEATYVALVEVEQRRSLPDDYLDVTLGRFARWKRWIKSKLLGNFKRGYVDVLSRQQSQVNQHVLAALQQLTECCATLDHALSGLRERIDRLDRPSPPVLRGRGVGVRRMGAPSDNPSPPTPLP